MSFLFQSLLTVGLPLVGLPLVIHLINLRRHRRIEWAAMDFLLESQKRNRKWIVLKQLLLLLLRTAAIAMVALMLAGPVVRSGWASLFGRGVTHHLVLLDDSYSMADHWGETSAFDQAKRVVGSLIQQARDRSDNQVVTLLPFSQAKQLSAGSGPEFDRRTLDSKMVADLEAYMAHVQPSETDAGPSEALEAASRLPDPTGDETRIVYLVSDFRRAQWKEGRELRQLAAGLREHSNKLILVDAVKETRPNLAITQLGPESGIRAAGVETWMEVAVVNYGDAAASAVTVTVEQDGVKLPAVVIDEIAPGKQATRRFRITFPSADAHQLRASLEGDAVATDNTRYFVAQIPATFPVLLVDGSADGDDGYYMRTALSPGGKNTAGWSPRVEPASFLRRHESIADYAAICLLDLPRLDDAEVSALENYVRAGGGLAIFVGPQFQKAFYNERFYHDGQGLFPAPLTVPTQLVRNSDAASPDLRVTEHPLFRVFGGQRNSFLSIVKVNFYAAIDATWSAPPSGDVHTLATLRNGAPLIVEKKFGAGRVVAQLCKLSPKATEQGVWSNLSVNPVFPVYANELVGYLSAARRRDEDRPVTEPVTLTVPEADYEPDARVRAPGAADGESVSPAAENGMYSILAPDKPHSGVWQFDLKTRDGKSETRLAAVNVPTGEGDLHRVEREELADILRGVDFEFLLASQVSGVKDDLAGFRLSDALLYLLLGTLVAEQLLAVSSSYHRRSGGGVA